MITAQVFLDSKRGEAFVPPFFYMIPNSSAILIGVTLSSSVTNAFDIMEG